MKSLQWKIGLAVLAVCGVFALPALGQQPVELAPHAGLLSLFPAAVTLVICFWTRNVILGLLCGIFAGGFVSGRYNVIDACLAIVLQEVTGENDSVCIRILVTGIAPNFRSFKSTVYSYPREKLKGGAAVIVRLPVSFVGIIGPFRHPDFVSTIR